MSAKEGLRRVNKLGCVLGIIGASLMLFAVVLGFLASRFPDATTGMSLAEFCVPGVGLLLTGIGIVTLGWIGEGFAGKGEPE